MPPDTPMPLKPKSAYNLSDSDMVHRLVRHGRPITFSEGDGYWSIVVVPEGGRPDRVGEGPTLREAMTDLGEELGLWRSETTIDREVKERKEGKTPA